MLNPDVVRWLHLSDFHVGRDKYGEIELFNSIIQHVQCHDKPDFIFITGDIAYSGLNSEYDLFVEHFLEKLYACVGENCRIFAVPGNHDINRRKNEFVTRSVIQEKAKNFFDPTKDGLLKRMQISERFSAYRNNELMQIITDQGDWLYSENGFYCYKKEMPDFKMGLLCLNTAWLSEDIYDERNLTPGKPIVKKGLEVIRDCDIKIVLGHHPVSWYNESESKMISSLFAQNNVVYLNGHRHDNCYDIRESSGKFFLSLQSGAAFQTREDDVLVNGFLWGELKYKKKIIEVEPWLWDKNSQEWRIDGMAFPDVFKVIDSSSWGIYLPEYITEKINNDYKKSKFKGFKEEKFFYGWDVIDDEYIMSLNKKPDENEVISYFNGKIPNWSLALSPDVPRRKIVGDVAEKILEDKSCLCIYMLLGAGGEGKSTALFQIIEYLLKKDKKIRVLYHLPEGVPLTKRIIEKLSDSFNWIIASDDADLISEDIYRIAYDLRLKGVSHIHFLLCSRHTDWRNAKINHQQWSKFQGYIESELRGISNSDARLIVDAWARYKEKGLGRLSGVSADEAARKLVIESKSEKSTEDGAFLGALLRLRFGDQLKDHVKKLLDRLQERKISKDNNISLLLAFTYIAAMHAENLLFLSKTVLARVLNVGLGDLRSKVLYPLGEEAAADVAGELVFTRHRAIAEVAIDILANTLYYNIELDEVYIDLICEAEELRLSGVYVTNLKSWRFTLPEHFFDKGNLSLSIRLTQALLRINSTDSFHRVKLSKLFRKAGQPDQSLRVFREAPIAGNDRVFFFEWALAEKEHNNYALAISLCALSLSDQVVAARIDMIDAKAILILLSELYDDLFVKYNNLVFADGAYVSAVLALKVLRLTDTVGNKLKNKLSFIENKYLSIITNTQVSLVDRLRYAFIEVAEYNEVNLPEWVFLPTEIEFSFLEGMLGL